MAERTPMVKVDGYWRELPAGDTVAGGGGGDYLDASGMEFLGTQTGGAAPTATEFPSGTFGFWEDTGAGEYYMVWHGNGGLRKSGNFTEI